MNEYKVKLRVMKNSHIYEQYFNTYLFNNKEALKKCIESYFFQEKMVNFEKDNSCKILKIIIEG